MAGGRGAAAQPEVASELRLVRSEVERGIEESARLDNDADDGESIRPLYRAYDRALQQQLRLIEAGRQAQAEQLDEERLGPSFDALQDLIHEERLEHSELADGRGGQAQLGSAGALLVAAILVALLFWRREQAQLLLRQLTRQNESILNAAGEGIYGLDRDGRTTFANPAAARMTGHEVEELLGRKSHDMVHHTRPDGTPFPVEECEASASIRDGVFHRSDHDVYWRKDGTSFPVEFTGTPIVEDGEVTGAVVVFKDITERKAAEALLERQRRQLTEAQSVGGFGSWDWDIAANRTEWSDELYRIYGLEPSDDARTLEDFLGCVHPDDRAAAQAEVQAAFESGEPFSFEHRIVRPDGAVRVCQARGEVVQGDDGAPVAMLGTGQDITERREVERAKDEFTSVVSHELRTPLTSIRGSLGLLAGGMLGPLPEKGQRMVEIAVQNTDRLVRLINDILDIERIDSGQIDMQPEPSDARELIARATEALASFAARAEVTLVADAAPARLSADPDRIIQTLTNLISNAVKFSPPGGSVRVSSERRDGEVLFQVSDVGRGIPAEKLDAIFERFPQVDARTRGRRAGRAWGLRSAAASSTSTAGASGLTARLARGAPSRSSCRARSRTARPSPATSRAVAQPSSSATTTRTWWRSWGRCSSSAAIG